MTLDLRQIRYFVMVAEEGHISRAAERLGMQQPPLSLQIKRIESTLGTQLFRREARGVSLTAAGETLLAEVRPLLAQLDRAVQATLRTSRGEQGDIRVGIAPTATYIGLVSRSIRDFKNAFPHVRLTLEEGLSDDVAARMRTGDMEVAFVRNANPRFPDIAIRPLLEEEMILALSDDHFAARRTVDQPVAMSELVDDRFILIGAAGTALHDQTLAVCGAAGFSPNIGQRAPRITSALGLVAAGLGVSIIPASSAGLFVHGVVYRGIVDPVPPMSFLGLAWIKSNRSPILHHFIHAVETRFFGQRHDTAKAGQSTSSSASTRP